MKEGQSVAPLTGQQPTSKSVIDLRPQPEKSAAVIDVALLDAQPVFRRGVKALLADDPAIAVIADTADLQTFVGAVGTRTPDVILCDINLVDAQGQLLSLRLREQYPDSHVVMVAGVEDEAELARAVRGGARGYLLRRCSITELHETVVAAARGESILAPSVATRLLDELATMVRRTEHGPEGLGALSKREREVLGLVAEGMNNRAIAAHLFISENTVKNHVRNIHEKLGVHTRMEAVVRAVREGMLKIA